MFREMCRLELRVLVCRQEFVDLGSLYIAYLLKSLIQHRRDCLRTQDIDWIPVLEKIGFSQIGKVGIFVTFATFKSF